MNRHSFAASLVAVTMLPAFSTSLFAADFSIQPRASIGYQNYEFVLENVNDLDVEADYVYGGLGVTGQIGKFFVDLYGQTNLTDAEFSEDFTEEVDRDADIDRVELNLTTGYAFNSFVTVFGGLKYAKNEIDQEFNSEIEVIDDLLSNDFVNFENEYFGPFAGLALSIPIANVGSVSISGALAYLDGESTLDAVILNEVVADDDSIDGSAIGFNVGGSWSGNLAPLSPALSRIGYSVGVDYSSYDFEDDGDDVYAERTLRVRTDVKYRF